MKTIIFIILLLTAACDNSTNISGERRPFSFPEPDTCYAKLPDGNYVWICISEYGDTCIVNDKWVCDPNRMDCVEDERWVCVD
jgi:hypothetical protein